MTARTVEIFLKASGSPRICASAAIANYDDPRTHAVLPPPLCGLDDRPDPPRTARDRTSTEACSAPCSPADRIRNRATGRVWGSSAFPVLVGRVEAAAERAIDIGALNYGSVKSILDNNLDPSGAKARPDGTPILHPNIRGPRYYN